VTSTAEIPTGRKGCDDLTVGFEFSAYTGSRGVSGDRQCSPKFDEAEKYLGAIPTLHRAALDELNAAQGE
jgi:hypothetical protein